MRADKSKCLICEVPCNQKGLSFFKFPEDELRLKIWIKHISPLLDILKIDLRSLKENGRICARHFREKDFTDDKQNSLVRCAYPSLRVSNLSAIPQNEENFPEEANNENEKDILQCGRCRKKFEILSDFIDHKKNPCPRAIARSGRRKLPRTKDVQPNDLVPLKNVFINSFDNQLGSLEQGNKSSEQIIKIVEEEAPGDGIISLVINNDKLVVDYPADITAPPNQELSTPNVDDNGVPKSSLNNSTDLSLANQVIVFPETPIDANGAESSYIITTSEGIIYTCPIQDSNDVVISPAPAEPATNQIILPAGMTKPTKGIGAGDGIIYCELTNVVNASPGSLLLKEGKKVGVKEAHQTEESGSDEKKTRLACSYCKKVFNKAFNLEQHERIHTGERPFQCIICGRAFKQKANVRKHMLRHKVWPGTRRTLKPKAQIKEGGGGSMGEIDYSCQYCPLRFKSYPEHKKHMADHSDKKVYRCIQKGCIKTFLNVDEFLLHAKTMHSSAEFQCHVCLKSFTNLTELGVHQYDHSEAEKEKGKEFDISRKLRCEVCNARFKSTEAFHNHLAVDTHRYECPLCQRVFCTERFLRRHLLNHNNPLRLSCQYCKKTFNTKQNLRNHVFVHLKQKPYTCDHCDKQFGLKARLKRHLAIHLSEHLECPFKKHLGCNKTFYRKDKLRNHVAKHRHCKARSCRLCFKQCRTLPEQQQQQQHLKRDYNGIFKCLACSQTFRWDKLLTKHRCVGEKAGKGEEMKEEAVSNIEIIMMPFGTSGRDIP